MGLGCCCLFFFKFEVNSTHYSNTSQMKSMKGGYRGGETGFLGGEFGWGQLAVGIGRDGLILLMKMVWMPIYFD